MRRSVGVRWKTLLLGGLVVGGLDLVDAIVFFGTLGATPVRILQSIAAGLLGRDVSRGAGFASAALGLALQFFNGFLIVTFYYLASRVFPILTRRPVVGGLVYGPLVHLFMYFVVIPLSAIGKPSNSPAIMTNGLLGHALLVGLPAALFSRRADEGTRASREPREATTSILGIKMDI